MEKKIPQRMCIACKNLKDKKCLIRIVKNSDGFVLDKTGKINGRGAYVCNNADCIKIVVKKHLINKSFKQNVPEDVYQNLLIQFEKEN